MATHEELALIREARSGKLSAQLDLGTRYLRGSTALPTNLDAAMHWLGAAAQQGSVDACSLIARHVPLDCALAVHDAATLAGWFRQAFEAGTTEAGLLFAKLVLQDKAFAARDMREHALAALQTAAHCGSHEAQWLWAGELRRRGGCEEAALAWEKRAAQGGLDAARLSLADEAKKQGDVDAFLIWALPVARAAMSRAPGKRASLLTAEQVRALRQCAEVLAARQGPEQREARTFWECAAASGDTQAQLHFGLWLAGLRADDEPEPHRLDTRDQDEAMQWLVLAGRQGVADAWYALSRLYGSARHSRPNAELQRHYRQKAAELGHCRAQYECGACAWNNGEGRTSSMVRALYWLELASAQGCTMSLDLLRHIRQSNAEMLCKTLSTPKADRKALFIA
ncbi:MAG TPA: hypothetical protein VF472_04595 [Burkholderiaceae bacterium]